MSGRWCDLAEVDVAVRTVVRYGCRLVHCFAAAGVTPGGNAIDVAAFELLT